MSSLRRWRTGVNLLKEMRAAGVQLDTVGDDYACFTTDDVKVAERFGMEREDIQDLIENDTSDARAKAFDPLTGELIATGDNFQELETALKGRAAVMVGCAITRATVEPFLDDKPEA
jgi:hypothetical protein